MKDVSITKKQLKIKNISFGTAVLGNYYEVFSVGSITFCGSLYFNKYKNSISQLLKNIIKHFIKTKS